MYMASTLLGKIEHFHWSFAVGILQLVSIEHSPLYLEMLKDSNSQTLPFNCLIDNFKLKKVYLKDRTVFKKRKTIKKEEKNSRTNATRLALKTCANDCVRSQRDDESFAKQLESR